MQYNFCSFFRLLGYLGTHKADVEAVCLAEELGNTLVMDDPKGIEVSRLRGARVEPSLTYRSVMRLITLILKRDYSYRELLKTQFRVKTDIYDRILKFLEIARSTKGDE